MRALRSRPPCPFVSRRLGCALAALAALALVACGDDDGGTRSDAGPSVDAGGDATLPDASPADAGPGDAGPLDAAPLDTGPADAAPTDLGPRTDAACPPPTGSGCAYVRTEGTAHITALETPGPAEYACRNDPVRVVFDFAPTDPAARACYTVPDAPDTGRNFTISGGAHPSRACADASGLAAGVDVRAVRLDIVSGTCTPVLFELPDVDLDRCTSLCMF